MRILFALLTLVLATSLSLAAEPVLLGRVFKVTDGDTIKVQLQSGPINVRFDSIDAPESKQPHGAEATAALARLVAGEEVELEVVSQDRYSRLVAVVHVHGLNVNQRMVQEGHAWAYRRYSKKPAGTAYCKWEDEARKKKLGLWSLPSSDWIYPSDWRLVRRHQITNAPPLSNETRASCIAAIGKR